MMMEDDYTRPPGDKAELLRRIDREWSRLEGAFSPLSETQLEILDEGGWSVKDNLAHLAAWEQFMRLYYLGDLPAHEAMQVDQETYERLDEDGLNEIIRKRSQNRLASDVIADLRHSHQQVLADLESLSFDDLREPLDDEDPERRPVIDWVIGNTYEHYREHRLNIEKLIQKF
jgi:hypothetical protein